MAELLGAAEEFRLLRISSSSDNDADDNKDSDLTTMEIDTAVRIVFYA